MMTKKKYICLLMAVGMIASCDFETSNNGNLDGFWQLSQVDSVQVAGGYSVDMKPSGVFWSVQHKMLEARNVNVDKSGVIFRFEHTGDKLILSSPIANVRNIGDSIVTDVETVKQYGLTQLSDTFIVEQLDDSDMRLRNKLLRLHFRKY